ncbi:MAG: DUF1156 domain-containing protein, partial [Verrucomicrobia bacterium]|nr:DUF1156 domain-containing protein [Verrucomicrobiota bacterium]
MTDKPRLIEVAFPLKQASLTSVHEKNVRHGHISTLHIWPARRPLAACRAALLCTLLPDPGDAQKRQELLDLIGGTVVKRSVTSEDEDGNTVSEEKETVEGGVLAWGNENDPAMDTLRAAIKKFYGGNAPKVLDPFAGGGAIPLEAMRLGCDVTSADLNPVAWFIQKCTLEYPQRFAGKKWPLPDFVREWPDFIEDFLSGKVKKRKGDKKPHFTDARQLFLTRQAVPTNHTNEEERKDSRGFVKFAGNKTVGDLPDADLAWQVRAWGRWVLERAKQELAPRYPTVDGEPTVAYLWARTARDPQTTGRVPLLKTFWLCKKKGKRAALLPVPKADGTGVTFKLLRETDLAQPTRIVEDHEFLRRWEVTADNFEDFIKHGTMNRAGVWSPCSGRPGVVALTRSDLQRQGRQELLSEQMTAVVTVATATAKSGKKYRTPTEREVAAAVVETEDLENLYSDIPYGLPNEPIVEDAKRNTWCTGYGVRHWRDLFLPRQQLCVGTILKNLRAAHEQLKGTDTELADAMLGCFGLALSRFNSFNCKNVRWKLDAMAVVDAFARFAIPVLWDFAEVNPISDSAGAFSLCYERIATALETLLNGKFEKPGTVHHASALTGIPDSMLDIVMTDPPYYDEIGYSVVMDFFYIWLRRLVSHASAELERPFRDELAPKWDEKAEDGELVDDARRFGGNKLRSKQNYEDGMAKVFQKCCSILENHGRVVIVFANKDVDAWET